MINFSAPPSSVKFVDTQTGLVTHEWYIYLVNLLAVLNNGVVGTADQVLHGGGAGYEAVDLAADISGFLAVLHGGTGASTAAGARANLGAGTGTATSVALALAKDDTVLVSGSPVTTSGTLTGTAVDAGSDQIVFWDDSADKKAYLTLDSSLVIIGTTMSVGVQPWEINLQKNAAPGVSECLLRFDFARTVVFAAGLSPSRGIARTAATAQTDLDIQKNGASVGTVRWAIAGTVASFIAGSPITFAAGDILEVFAPAVPDATLAGIGVTLAGLR